MNTQAELAANLSRIPLGIIRDKFISLYFQAPGAFQQANATTNLFKWNLTDKMVIENQPLGGQQLL